MKFIVVLLLSISVYGNDLSLRAKFSKSLSSLESKKLKKEVFDKGADSIATLIEVVADKKNPIKNRWSAIFYIGQIIGVQSEAYLTKLSLHKNWMIRLASLKTLTNLGIRTEKVYSHFLNDKAMIIRYQALNSISGLKIKSMGARVWSMLYDDRNYSAGTAGRKRSSLIKKVIKVVGDLEYKKVKKPLLKMVSSPKYKDIFSELDYSLAKITNKTSRGNSLEAKRMFWKVQNI